MTSYRPTWNSLRQHRTPEWFRNAKFGIYTHWGIYCVPACGPNASWYPYNMYREGTPQHDHHVKTYGGPEKNDICALIREAEDAEVVVTRHGKPAAVIIGFADDDAWFDYRLEHDERFLQKIAKARDQIKRGEFVSLDKLPD